ncbi:DUF1294 domain-containing protein [Roseomonas sp. HJA6]|uniref:DUF1294 domain-containing protein n=1 Tax=Roseomonas alba TaxID=2846776 RepID=A0ABS7AJ51_9PROT|nr:DUF1294 domain-containing protein [Neoroseomonas alba]MBW6401762.1 DUF1294 domain-containing protein [Neoroseomonas alba]
MTGDALNWAAGIGCWLIGINGLTVIAFHHDKRRARSGGRRVSERALLSLAALGGSPGAFAARHRFRHKTRKQSFTTALRTIVLLQMLVLVGAAAYALWEALAPRLP